MPVAVTTELAKFIVNTNFGSFDEQTVRVGKELVYDGLGAMVRGARENVSQIAIRHIKNVGGVAEVGIMGGGFRSSITNAALVNGINAHSAEQEAVGKFGGSCTFVTIPAAFAVAEKFNLSGKALLEGFIIGQEVQGKGEMGPGHLGPVDGKLLICPPVEHPPHCLQGRIEVLGGRPPLRPLEKQVLQEMGRACLLVPLTAGAGPDEDDEGDGADMGGGGGDNAQAVGELGALEHPLYSRPASPPCQTS